MTSATVVTEIKNVEEALEMKAAAAGVLPIWREDSETGMLLGRESFRPNYPASLTLCDFGGSVKRSTSAFSGATEEFFEETCGALFDEKASEQTSRDFSRDFCKERLCGVFKWENFSWQNNSKSPYMLFVIKISKAEALYACDKFLLIRNAIHQFSSNSSSTCSLLPATAFKKQGSVVKKEWLEKDLLASLPWNRETVSGMAQLIRTEFLDIVDSDAFHEFLAQEKKYEKKCKKS